jgi:hypothetical protein
MTKTFTIDSEAAEAIFKDVLVDDYNLLCSLVDELRSKDELKPYQQEDLADNLRYKEHFEALIVYYYGEWAAQSIIKK